MIEIIVLQFCVCPTGLYVVCPNITTTDVKTNYIIVCSVIASSTTVSSRNYLCVVTLRVSASLSDVTPWRHAMTSRHDITPWRHTMPSRHDVTHDVTPWRHAMTSRHDVTLWRRVTRGSPLSGIVMVTSHVMRSRYDVTLWRHVLPMGSPLSGIVVVTSADGAVVGMLRGGVTEWVNSGGSTVVPSRQCLMLWMQQLFGNGLPATIEGFDDKICYDDDHQTKFGGFFFSLN